MIAASDPVIRVRKLLRLAESSNPNEAALAKQRAHVIMGQYGLTDDDIVERVNVIEVAEEYTQPHLEELARVVGMACGATAVVSSRGDTLIAFRGPRDAVQVARSAYQSLADYGDDYCEMADQGDPPTIARQAWRLCWWIGYLRSTGDRIRQHQGGPAPRPENAIPLDARPATPAAAVTAANDAMSALECLGDYLDGEVDDITVVLDRLRSKALAAGEDAGYRVSLQDIPRTPGGVRPRLAIGGRRG